MNAVAACFNALRQRGECALIPFLTAGDPDLATTAEALRILDRAGADLIELGVPYSDPLADGPVIQAAATRALQKGVKLDDVLAIVREVHQDIAAPIILFTYYNPIFYQGVEVFLDKIKAAGVKGLVVPDLPLEESDRLLEATAERGLELILLVAPTSSPERQTAIAKKSQGFVYLVSVTGVTGVRTEVGSRVEALLAGMRQVTDKPIGVGFGISQPEQAEQVKAWGADAVIVGSAMVKRLAEGTPTEGLQALETFCRELKTAIS
ncbi:tryptophan synthase alpha chain [Synechocystis sp. PCC 6803]|uniref:Tryptophan synthase alpha chain n=1 Tax=Synechocystis sp. (strain ATCC 27184 / PCC 6803 / Kazusa) TaxID=1111708 RepID=TRPA_SYNY3|nr:MULTISPECIES: tryptophan synthase subunit alpha [unclassified Synechocystis]P77960.1 RecName: Full=Tryptophan synthase alpha chain [Synechocystis sp. PCC 6803 substr. Kazusa]AGF50561.1 tryptophan synthase alpha chain [Synechocystis sp. PCC 6803]ALJ66638.1 tryptophan synthase subunit alpha [Synechocystis sp. PCC 6803]AVP88481.1 tryptophan synthase subunit alpha [Synechocystis sp. IPPAS B-1465]MBD2617160.1 tryptophan synthase subunit alpha [Synechocystis sp. FACHB-898]MBD2638603.1 tryptophan